jgi:hypothetical protein
LALSKNGMEGSHHANPSSCGAVTDPLKMPQIHYPSNLSCAGTPLRQAFCRTNITNEMGEQEFIRGTKVIAVLETSKQSNIVQMDMSGWIVMVNNV